MRLRSILKKTVSTTTRQQVLEEILKNTSSKGAFFHIVSLNPEILMAAKQDPEFLDIVLKAQMTIIDGVGIQLAAERFGIQVGERYSGVDLMSDLLKMAHTRRLRVLLVGGGPKIAEAVVNRQKEGGSKADLYFSEGFTDIHKPTQAELAAIDSIVATARPHIIFAAFGSPAQEKWLWHNRAQLACICMGVGGSFDFLAGVVPRAPRLVRRLGMEWLFRLIHQPWRVRRQARLISFMAQVLFDK